MNNIFEAIGSETSGASEGQSMMSEEMKRRQAQGIAKALSEGAYKGRREDVERNAGILRMLKDGQSYSAIQAVTGCSRATVAKIAKRIPQGVAA
jgi:DNA invertase Pin-like site-specific DNA recombinase